MSNVVYNPRTGQGTKRDKASYFIPNESTVLDFEFQENLAEGWPMSEICSAYPEDSIKKWCSLNFSEGRKGLSPDQERAFENYRLRLGSMDYLAMSRAYAKEMGFRTKKADDSQLRQFLRDGSAGDAQLFADAGYRANVHGGSAIVLNIQDGRPPEAPVDYHNIKSIRSVQVVDRHHLQPDLSKNFLSVRPEHYFLTIMPGENDRLTYAGGRSRRGQQNAYDGMGRQMYRIHVSRILLFPGERTPTNRRRQVYQGWWRSKVEVVWEHYKNWAAGLGATSSLLQDYSIFVWKISQLQELVEGDKKGVLQGRLDRAQQLLSNYGGLIIGEGEEVSWLNRSFSEIPNVLDRFKDALTGASGIPHTRLFKEGPNGGLSATGNSEHRDWSAMVNTWQVNEYEPPLMYLYTLIFLAADGPTSGQIPDGWGLQWHSIYEETPEEELDRLGTYIGALTSLKGSEIITDNEARAGFSGSEIRYDITLDEKAWKQREEEVKQQEEAMLAQQQGQAELPAGEEEEGFGDLTEEEIDAIIAEAAEAGLSEEETVEVIEEEAERRSDSLMDEAIAIASSRFKLRGNYWKAAVSQEYQELLQTAGASRNGTH